MVTGIDNIFHGLALFSTDNLALLGAIGTWLGVFRPNFLFRSTYMPVYREQLDKVYYPMFSTLEPYLYKQLDIDTASSLLLKIDVIAKENYVLTDSSLINILQILIRDLEKSVFDKRDYDMLCDYVVENFDKTRRYLGMPTRSFGYKLNRKQFRIKFLLYTNLIETLAGIFIVSLLYLIMMGIVSLITGHR